MNNIVYVMQRKSLNDSNELKGKRRFPTQNITVTENNTQIWEVLGDQLFHAKDIAHRKAHLTIMEPPNGPQNQDLPSDILPNYALGIFDQSPPSTIMSSLNSPTSVTELFVDWRIEYQLWKKLTKELKKRISDVRNQYFPPNSGGDMYHNKINQKAKDSPQHGNKAMQY